MRSSFCTLLFAALLLTLAGAHRINGQSDPSNDPANKLVEDEILATANAGKLPLALQMANAYIYQSPEWKSLLLVRAQIHKAMKQPGLVIADYSSYIRKTPVIEANLTALARLHVWRADEYLGVGDHESALADFAKAITYGGSNFVNSFTNHTREHLTKKDPAAAIADHTKVIANVPANKAAQLYASRARLNHDYGNLDASIADYNKMNEIAPGGIVAPYYLGQFYSKKGDLNSAVRVYTSVIQNYKGSDRRGLYEWYNYRAAAYRNAGNYDASLADYARSIEVHPAQQQAYLGRVTVLIKRGTRADHTAAIQDLGILIDQERKKPTDKKALVGYLRERGLLWFVAGSATAGLEDLKAAMAIAPDDASLYAARAAIYCDQGLTPLAKADEAAVIRLGSRVAKPCTAGPAKPVKSEAPISKAVVPVEKTIAVPVTAVGWFARGEQHLDDQDLKEAIDAFTKAIKLKPAYAEAYGRRAVAHFAGMSQTQAFGDINKAIALDPTDFRFYLTRSGFYCFRWRAAESEPDLQLAKRDEAKALQLGGKVTSPCGQPAN